MESRECWSIDEYFFVFNKSLPNGAEEFILEWERLKAENTRLREALKRVDDESMCCDVNSGVEEMFGCMLTIRSIIQQALKANNTTTE